MLLKTVRCISICYISRILSILDLFRNTKIATVINVLKCFVNYTINTSLVAATVGDCRRNIA